MALPRSPFVKADSLYGSLQLLVIKADDAAGLTSGVTAAAATDILTKTSHGFETGDIVTPVSATSGAGLTIGTPYFVSKIDADTFYLCATYEDAIASTPVDIDITTDYVGLVLRDTWIFEANQLNDLIEQGNFNFQRTDAAGVLRNVRTIPNRQQEAWTFTFDQAKRLPAIFAGGLVGRRDVFATIYKADPADASGKVALKSEADFSATMLTEGASRTGGGEGTLPTLRIESNKQGVVTWTKDASV